MKTLPVFIAAILMCHACATTQPATTSTVRVVTEEEKATYGCEFVASVSGFDEYDGNPTLDAEHAMEKAKNKAAAQGANAIRVIFVDSNVQGSSVSTEALKCNFTN